MREPNDESYKPARDFDPEEQKWLRNERDEQEWLREQQEIFPQQVRNIAAAPATWRLREAPEGDHGSSVVYASGCPASENTQTASKRGTALKPNHALAFNFRQTYSRGLGRGRLVTFDQTAVHN